MPYAICRTCHMPYTIYNLQPAICPYAHMPICPYALMLLLLLLPDTMTRKIMPSAHLPICPSAHLPIYSLPICPSVHLSISVLPYIICRSAVPYQHMLTAICFSAIEHGVWMLRHTPSAMLYAICYMLSAMLKCCIGGMPSAICYMP
jgi:hypothetical protein